MADKKKDKNKDNGGEKAEKSGKGKKGSDAEKGQPYTSIATHPRASAGVGKAKGWGGLAGFAITAVLSFKAQVPFVQALERALLFGLGGYLLAWALSLFVWRQLMLAEQRAAVAELERRRAAAIAADQADKPPRRAAPASSGRSPA